MLPGRYDPEVDEPPVVVSAAGQALPDAYGSAPDPLDVPAGQAVPPPKLFPEEDWFEELFGHALPEVFGQALPEAPEGAPFDVLGHALPDVEEFGHAVPLPVLLNPSAELETPPAGAVAPAAYGSP